MRLRELRDVYLNQDFYIVGSGPTSNLFPYEFLQDKICISLNDAFKIHPAIGPVALMHTSVYANQGKAHDASVHPHFETIRYPIAKVSSKVRLPDELADWDNPHFYYFDWSHQIEDIWKMTKETDYLYYTPEGCSLHGAMQVAWIMGAKNIFIIGCDSRTFGGLHYANYDKNQFRADEKLSNGAQRNYDSYVYGTLIVQDFLKSKGINVFNLSSIIGYHQVDLQFDVLKGNTPMDEIYRQVKEI